MTAKTYYVDIPNPKKGEPTWINISKPITKKAALALLRCRYGIPAKSAGIFLIRAD